MKLFNLKKLNINLLPLPNLKSDAERWNTLSNKEKLLAHMARGETVSPLEALGVFRAYRLSGEIHALRKKGWQIESTESEDVTGRVYSRYRLKSLTRSDKSYVSKRYNYQVTPSRNITSQVAALKNKVSELTKTIIELEKAA